MTTKKRNHTCKQLEILYSVLIYFLDILNVFTVLLGLLLFQWVLYTITGVSPLKKKGKSL